MTVEGARWLLEAGGRVEPREARDAGDASFIVGSKKLDGVVSCACVGFGSSSGMGSGIGGKEPWTAQMLAIRSMVAAVAGV